MENIKQNNNNIPVPHITIDRQGKVLSANEHMGEVFLYEGIVGADVFTLTGFKAQDLFDIAENRKHPILSRNEKKFKVVPYHETDDENVLAVVFLDVTGFEELKDRYNDEKPASPRSRSTTTMN